MSPETEILLPSIINPLIFAVLITSNIGTLFPVILLLLPSSLPLNSTSIIESSEEKSILLSKINLAYGSEVIFAINSSADLIWYVATAHELSFGSEFLNFGIPPVDTLLKSQTFSFQPKVFV